MDLQSIFNSRFGIGFALTLGRIMPAKMGYWLARTLANRIAQRKDSAMVCAARANQWVINGENMNSQQLDIAVQETLRCTARCQFDLYHNIRNPAGILRIVRFSPQTEELLEQIKVGNQGFMVVGLHISNMDVGFIALSQRKLKALAISVPQPGGGYQWQNDLREGLGFDFIPASKKALRLAYQRLNEGGVVATGIDRPIQDMKYRPNFFGRPASLPVFHVLLALRSKVPIYVSANILDADGIYHIHVSDAIQMQPRTDRYSEIMYNAEAVLEVAEEYVRMAQNQWAMYFPVWPEVLDKVP